MDDRNVHRLGTPDELKSSGTRPLSILLVGDEHDLTVSNALEMPPVRTLAIAFRGLHELLARDLAVLVGDLLHDRDGQALCALYGAHTPSTSSPRRKHTNSWKSKACQVRHKPHCPQP